VVLTALGANPLAGILRHTVGINGFFSLGCGMVDGHRVRDLQATTSAADAPGFERACACRDQNELAYVWEEASSTWPATIATGSSTGK
jgi:hypothetical protein